MYDPMFSRVLDVSRYQYTFNNQGEITRYMDFEKAKAQGIEAVAIRCTVGNYYRDPAFETSWRLAGQAGLKRTAYHVIAPADSYGNKITADSQVAWFLSHLGGRDPDWDDIILDVELDRDQPRAWIDGVVKGCRNIIEQQYGLGICIYTRKYWWEQYMFRDHHWTFYPLWVANYTSAAQPLIPIDWDDWTLWQWSADNNDQGEKYGSGGDDDIDLSRLAFPEYLDLNGNGGNVTNKYFEETLEQAKICEEKGYNYLIQLPVLNFDDYGEPEPPTPPEPPEPPEPPQPPEDKPFVENPNEEVDRDYTSEMIVEAPNDTEAKIYLKVTRDGKDFAEPYKYNGKTYKIPNGSKVTVWDLNHPVDGGGNLRKWWGVMAPNGDLLWFDRDTLKK